MGSPDLDSCIFVAIVFQTKMTFDKPPSEKITKYTAPPNEEEDEEDDDYEEYVEALKIVEELKIPLLTTHDEKQTITLQES